MIATGTDKLGRVAHRRELLFSASDAFRMCAKSVGCPLNVEEPIRISELPLLPLVEDACMVSGEPAIFDLSPVVESGKSVRR